MNKNSGFTLTELLAVVLILSILVTLATTGIMTILNRSKNDISTQIRNNLKESALTYVLESFYLQKCERNFSLEMESGNTTNLDANKTCFKSVTVSELVEKGFFDNNRDTCKMEDSVIVYRYDNGDYSDYKTYIGEDVCRN